MSGDDRLRQLLKDHDAWRTGHFLLSSGMHSDQYVQCQKILQYPRYGMMLARVMVERVGALGLQVDSVVGPALGAVHWELLLACALEEASRERPVKAVFAERRSEGDGFEIRRGVIMEPGERFLVAEDVSTTGGSAKKVVELIRSLGAEPVAVAAIVDRGGAAAAFDVPLVSLLSLQLITFAPGDCTLCRQGLPLDKPGSSR